MFSIFVKTNCAMEIPRGNSREDIKARKQIIKDFYATWIAEHPENTGECQGCKPQTQKTRRQESENVF